jgi:uncharacterized protein
VIAEDGTDQAISLWQQAGGGGLPPGLARGGRPAGRRPSRRRVSDEGYRAATDRLRLCFERCTVVSLADSLVDHAAELAAIHDLRAADAVHLATALAAMETDSVFVTWDKRPRLAAVGAGLASAPAAS